METSLPGNEMKKLRWILLGAAAFGVAAGIAIGLCTKSGYYGFHGGFFAAFAFGIATKRLLGLRTALPAAPRLDPIAEGFDAGETIFHFGPANHFKGLESVGGKLFLTDRRLRFRSHAFNVQTHDESYPLGWVRHVEASRTLGIVPNGLLVHFADGRRERFVVGARDVWIAQLGEAVKALGRQTPDRAPDLTA